MNSSFNGLITATTGTSNGHSILFWKASFLLGLYVVFTVTPLKFLSLAFKCGDPLITVESTKLVGSSCCWRRPWAVNHSCPSFPRHGGVYFCPRFHDFPVSLPVLALLDFWLSFFRLDECRHRCNESRFTSRYMLKSAYDIRRVPEIVYSEDD